MKNRRHRERPSGKPKVKERKPCLLCGRHLMKKATWRRGETAWHCPKCRMTYKYEDGILTRIGHPAIEEWWLDTNWFVVPAGMLVVYGGVE